MKSELPYEITQRPDFALVTVQLEPGQKVFAEPSVMASMDASVSLEAGLTGGLGASIGRAMGGESLIMNTFTASDGPGSVCFAAGQPGDAVHYHLDGNAIYMQSGAFMARSEGVEVVGTWGGARGFFSGQGLVLLKAMGHGDVFFNSYGAILEVDVDGDYVVDTGYIAAFEDTLEYTVSAMRGLSIGAEFKTFFFGGEGLVVRLLGQGKVWIQTRAVNPFLTWVYPFRPKKQKKNN